MEWLLIVLRINLKYSMTYKTLPTDLSNSPCICLPNTTCYISTLLFFLLLKFLSTYYAIIMLSPYPHDYKV